MIELRWVQRPKSKTVSHLPDVAVICYQRVLQFRFIRAQMNDGAEVVGVNESEWQDVPEVNE